MNKQELKGNVSKITGTIKEQAGKIMDDEALQTEGKIQYLSGSIREFYGMKKAEMYKALNGLINSFSGKKAVPVKPVEVKV